MSAHNIQLFSGAVEIPDDLRVVSLTVEDGLVELGANGAFANVGYVMNNPGGSNAAVYYDKTVDQLRVVHTDFGGKEDPNTITISNEDITLNVGGNVHASFFRGDGGLLSNLVSDLQSVTAVEANSDQMIILSNATALWANVGNVLVEGNVTSVTGGFHGDGGWLTNVQTTFEETIVNGNTTSNIVEFHNALSLVTTGAVGIANTQPLGDLSIGANVVFDDDATDILKIQGNVNVQRITIGEWVLGGGGSQGLQQITDTGNTTTITTEFNNVATSFVTAAKAGIGIATPSSDAMLHVDGHVRLGGAAETPDNENMFVRAAGALNIIANESNTDNSTSNLVLKAGEINAASITLAGAVTDTLRQAIVFKTREVEALTIDRFGNANFASNVVVASGAKFIGDGSGLTGLVSDLQSVSEGGDNTDRTIFFTNATEGANIESNLYVGSNLHLDDVTLRAASVSLQGVTANGASTPDAITITNSTEATSTSAGALMVTGGIAAAKDIRAANVVVNRVGVGLASGSNPDPDHLVEVDGNVKATNVICEKLTFEGVTIQPTFSLDQVVNVNNTTSNIIVISNTTPSTSASTGCLQLSGGLGVNGNVYASGDFVNVNNSGWRLPNSYATRPSVNGSAIPGELTGGNSDVDAGFLRLSGGGSTSGTGAPKSFIDISGASTSADLANTIVLGVKGSEKVRLTDSNLALAADTQLVVSNLAPATSNTTGAVQIAGGLGVAGNAHVGETLTVDGDMVLSSLRVDGTVQLSDGLSNTVDMNVVSSTGLWNEVQKLTGPVEKTDYFGYDVSFSGDGTYAAVAGYGTNNRGLVYIFKNDGSTWGIQQVLTASDAATDDYFGTLALSKDGTHLIVGAYGNDDTASASGSAYIFSRSGNTWSQLAKLTASNPVQNAYFGINVDMNEDGSRVVISAWGEEAAYVYLKPSGGWTNTAQEDAKLTASDGSSGDNFAYNVAMSSDGNYIVAGVRLAHKAYIFVTSDGGASWTEQQKITASDAGITDSSSTFGYGTAVSSDGTYVVISAPVEGDASGNGYGAVYVYVTTNGGTSWTKQQKLTASDAIRESSYLGRESALQISSDGSRIIAGAPWENDERGSAYVFDRSGTTWTQQSKIQLPTYDQGDYGGYAIAMTSDGQQILVSAHYDDARYFTGAGAVYVYKYDDSKRLAVSGGLRLTDGQSNVVDMNVTRDAASWATSEPLTMKVTSGGYAESYQNFGICVAISKDGNTAVVGSQDRAGGGASNSSVYGAVFVFERERRGTVGEWRMMARLIPNDRAVDDYFGRWVSISRDGSTIVSSSAWKHDNGPATSGCVYVFERPWSGWTDSAAQTAKLRTSDKAAGDYLGFPARISGDGSTIIACAAYDDDGTTVDAGKLNIWVKPSGGWVDTSQETAKLTPSTPATSALFGYKCFMSHDGSTIIAGTQTTSAYLYERPVGGWTTTNQETAKFTVSSARYLGFNCELSYDGSVAVVGQDPASATAGAAYVFEKPSSGWTSTSTPTATLTNSSTQNTNERFGLDVSISDDGNTIIASSYEDEPQMQIGQNNTGSVSVFVRTGDRWVDMTETVTFFAPEQRHYDLGFGHEVSLSGDGRTFCVGAAYLDNEVGNDVGAAYFFDLPEDRTNLAVSESSGLRAARYYGGIPTFLAYTHTAQTYVAATSRSTWFQVINHEFDVPEEYHHLDTANLFVSAEVRWFGEANAAWDIMFGLELRYGDNFEHILTHQKPTFHNSHLGHSAAGVACSSYPVNVDNSSTPEAAVVSSTFYLPGCPVRRGNKLFLALTMQTDNSYYVYTNRTINNHLGWNYENGTSHFFMALKVV